MIIQTFISSVNNSFRVCFYKRGDTTYKIKKSKKHRWVIELFNLKSHYDKGFLPHSGGILDQDSKLMDIFLFMDSLQNEYAEEQKSRRK